MSIGRRVARRAGGKRQRVCRREAGPERTLSDTERVGGERAASPPATASAADAEEQKTRSGKFCFGDRHNA